MMLGLLVLLGWALAKDPREGDPSSAEKRESPQQLASGDRGPEIVEGLAIVVSTNAPVVLAGAPIEIDVALRNEGDRAISTALSPWWCAYDVRVFLHGIAVERTQYGSDLLCDARSPARKEATIEPPGQAEVRMRLNRVFDMSVDGRYQIQVLKAIRRPDVGDFVVVVSNWLSIQVEESGYPRLGSVEPLKMPSPR